jgi:hypothetical protein
MSRDLGVSCVGGRFLLFLSKNCWAKKSVVSMETLSRYKLLTNDDVHFRQICADLDRSQQTWWEYSRLADPGQIKIWTPCCLCMWCALQEDPGLTRILRIDPSKTGGKSEGTGGNASETKGIGGNTSRREETREVPRKTRGKQGKNTKDARKCKWTWENTSGQEETRVDSREPEGIGGNTSGSEDSARKTRGKRDDPIRGLVLPGWLGCHHKNLMGPFLAT